MILFTFANYLTIEGMLKHFINKYPVSSTFILLIWVLSLVPFFPDTPLDNVKFIDKWTHLAMYGGTCTVMWWEYLSRHRHRDWRRIFLYLIIAPIVMGGVLELLQAYCTFGRRSGEWLDFVANTTGVFLATVVGLVLSGRLRPKDKKD